MWGRAGTRSQLSTLLTLLVIDALGSLRGIVAGEDPGMLADGNAPVLVPIAATAGEASHVWTPCDPLPSGGVYVAVLALSVVEASSFPPEP